MNRDPVLAVTSLRPSNGYKVARTFRVEGGLHHLRGNHAPYFTLTYTAHRKGFPNQCYSGGAGHEEILAKFPRFADLAALHLSDLDGVPMHAEANGWYNLAGALGGYGETYHGGNSERHFPIIPPIGETWPNTEYRKPTTEECLAIFAEHCRISVAEAASIRDDVRQHGGIDPEGRKAARARWAEIMETMRPRWKQEAEACIARHSLRIFGDPWPTPLSPAKAPRTP